MSTTTHIAAAVTGALVTVAVYEGVVHVRSDTEPTVHVQAGETRQLGEPRTVLREVPAAAPGPVVASSSTPTDEPSLAPEQRIAALEAQVAELSFERDLLQGQLAFVNGEPQAWPSDVPDAFQPEAFEERLAAELKQRGIGQIAVLDCNEYPCIAIVDVTPGTDPMALHASIGEIGDHFEADGRDASVMALVSKRETPDGESTMLALAITPDGDDVGDQRTKVRTEALLAEMEDATTDP